MTIIVKNTVFISFLLMANFSFAEMPQTMNQNGMQQIMEKMERIQQCMAKVGESEMKALETRSKQFRTEVRLLCDSGKRVDAQKKAIAFSKEMMKSPTIKTLKGCAKEMGDFVSKITVPDYADKDSNFHICDSGI